MRESDMERIRSTDWLKHRWRFSIDTSQMQGQTKYEVRLGHLVLSSHGGNGSARRWIEECRIISLAQAIELHPEFARATVLIEGQAPGFPSPRLARIPKQLWPTYDAIVLSRMPRCLSILSAKARAMFPYEASTVFVRARLPG